MHRISQRVTRLAVSASLALAIAGATVPAGFAAGGPQLAPARPGAPAAPYFLEGDRINPTGSAATYFITTGANPQGDWNFQTDLTDGAALRGTCLNGTNCVGVVGNSSGIGVRGISSGSYGAYGTAVSSGATGVRGDGDAYGLFGSAAASNGTGVLGTGATYGVYGSGTGTAGTGVWGTSSNSSGYGVYGYNNGTGSYGDFGVSVYGGQASSSSAGGYGFYATQTGTGTTYGVFANATAGNSASAGVYGNNTAGYGVFGHSSSGDGVEGLSTSGPGVLGSSGSGVGVSGNSTSNYAVVGTSTNNVAFRGSSTTSTGINATSSSGYGLIAQSTSNVGAYVSTSTGTKGLWAVNSTVDATHFALYVDGNARVNGNFHATGTCCSAADTTQGPRQMYAEEAPQNVYSDRGTAQLVHGRAVIAIDALYAQTVNLGVGYQVFVTAGSDQTQGLAVVHKTATSFEVRELGGGRGTFPFDWRIEALRKGYEGVRMAPAPAAPETPLPPAAPVPAPPVTNVPVPPALAPPPAPSAHPPSGR